MKIQYLGHSCYVVIDEKGTKVLTDPYQKVGYEMPKGVCADVVTVSHGHFDHNFGEGVKTDIVLTATERFCKNGVEIYGVKSYHDPKKGALRGENIIYIYEMDGKRLCHMGDIGEECSAEIAQRIGKIDILFIPVGGTYTVDALGAKKYVDALRPKVVVPMHYKPKDGTLDIDGISSFLSLYPDGQIVVRKEGEIEITENLRGIVYLERVKNYE